MKVFGPTEHPKSAKRNVLFEVEEFFFLHQASLELHHQSLPSQHLLLPLA